MNPAVLDELRRAGLLHFESGQGLTPKGQSWLSALAGASDEVPYAIPGSVGALIDSTFAVGR